MVSLPKTRRMYAVVWLGWFLALLLLACAYHLPMHSVDGRTAQVALPLLGSVVTHDPDQGAPFPWLSRARWRKWAWLHYQAACRVYARLRWTARLAYARAVWAAGVARLILSGAVTMAVIVDALTRAQLRRQLGALPVLYALLEVLHVREIVNRYCPTEAQVDHGAVVLVLNRLMAPRALVGVADWVAQTVLTQTLNIPADKFNDDRLGRTLDAIASHEREIWLEIVNAALVQFDIDVSFIFYDRSAELAPKPDRVCDAGRVQGQRQGGLWRFQKNNHPKRITVAAASPCGDGHGDARLRILGQFKFWKFLWFCPQHAL